MQCEHYYGDMNNQLTAEALGELDKLEANAEGLDGKALYQA